MNRQMRRLVAKDKEKAAKITPDVHVHLFGSFRTQHPFALAWRLPSSGRKLHRSGHMAEVIGMDHLVLFYPEEGLTEDEIVAIAVEKNLTEIADYDLDEMKAKTYSDRIKAHIMENGKLNERKYCNCIECNRSRGFVEAGEGKRLYVSSFTLVGFRGAYIP